MREWELICLDGSAAPERMLIDGAVEIGRDPHCDVRLLGDTGSRFHARLCLEGDALALHDLGSRNGTWLDGNRLAGATALAEGQLFRCGDSRFVVAAAGIGSQVLSDQGRSLQMTAIRAAPAPLGDVLDRLLAALRDLPLRRRPEAICRCAAGLVDGPCALLRAGATLAGELDDALARRLAGGQEPRLLQLGQELSGQTVAAAAIGSALVAPVDADTHLIAVRDREAEAFTAASLAQFAHFATHLGALLPSGNAAVIPDLVGESPCMQALRRRIARLARCDATVLISGPSGSGKEVVARNLHRLSGRSQGPFVAVNCAAINDSLFEAELFGASKGAYTGADGERIGRIRAADGGTLFLDEIAELPAAAQAKLLRVLQEGVVDPVGADQGVRVHIRLLAACNVDLHAAVVAGRFREDLYHRIDVLRVHTPALAEHPDDIPALAEHLLARAAERLELDRLPLSPAAANALRLHPWPGNIRQLGNALQRALVLAEGTQIDIDDLELDHAPPTTAGIATSDDFPTLEAMEREHIRAALLRCDGNKTHAAELLGIARQTLHKKLADGLGP